MPDNVVIQFLSDTESLQEAVPALEKIIATDEKLGAEFKKNNATFADRQRALDQQNKSTTAAKLTLDQLSNSVKELNKNVIGNASTKQVEQFASQIGAATKQSTTLTTQLRALREQLSALETAGKGGTKTFTDLSVQAARLQDQVQRTSNRIRILASDTKNLDAALSLATGIAGAFAVAQGAAALFGEENEEVQKALLKVQAALAILNGLQAVATTLNRTSAASVVIFGSAAEGAAVKTGLYGFALRAVTVIQRAFAVSAAAAWAIATAGLALLVTGIVLLIEKLNLETNATNDLYFAQLRLNHERAKAAERLEEQTKQAFEAVAGYGKKNEEVSRADIELAKIRGAKAEEIFNLEIKLLNDKLKFLELTGAKETDQYRDVLNQKKILTAKFYKDQKDQRQKDFEDLVHNAEKQTEQESGAENAEIERIANLAAAEAKHAQETDRIFAESAEFAIETGEDQFDLLAEFYQSDFETFKEFEEAKRAETEKTAEERIKADLEYVELFASIVDQLIQYGLDVNQSEINSLEDKHKRGLIGEKQYRKQLAELQHKQAVAEKAQSIFKATIATALAIVEALTIQPPAGEIAAAIRAVIAGVQLAAIIARPVPDVPQFAKGTEKVKGGKAGKDSVPAILMPGERIVPADINAQLGDIPNADLPKLLGVYPDLPYISNASMDAMEKYRSNGTGINYDLLGRSVAKYLGNEIEKHPRLNVTMDEKKIVKVVEHLGSKKKSIDDYYSWKG